MKKTVFAGSATALVTPMKEDLSIDFDLFGTLIQEQIRHGTDALVVAGTTGESATLTDEEHIELIRFAVKAAKGRVPVIAGAGSNSTAHALLLTKAAEKAGGPLRRSGIAGRSVQLPEDVLLWPKVLQRSTVEAVSPKL